MAPTGRTDPPLPVLLGVIGVVAMLGPVGIVLVVGWVTSLTVALAAGLAASLLLTMLLLAGGWWLLRQIQIEDRGPAPEDLTPPDLISDAERGERISSSDSPGPENRYSAFVRLLLVEDDLISQRVVARLLQQLGVQADVASDGQAALAAVAANEYALVLMDCQLPGLDGYAAAAEIRRRESASPGHARRLPIVALTSAARDADRQRALAAGMDEHLTKPLDLERLAALLARWRLHYEPPTAATDGSPTRPDRPGRPPILDPAGLPTVNGRLSEPYREIVRLYQREAASRMDALGVAAALPDHAQIARIAHTLAGSSSSIGALRMAAACVTLETVARERATNASTGSAPPSPRPSAPSGHPSGDHAGGDRALAESVEEVRRELQALETALTHLTAERPPI